MPPARTLFQVKAEKTSSSFYYHINMEPNGVRGTDSNALEETPTVTPRMSRQQVLTLISVASVNFSSMICYSILGPFFPYEAKKKGASQTVIGLIFGCYALCNLMGSLILGKYIVQIGAKFMLVSGLFVSSVCTILFGLLDKVPGTTTFVALCFIIRSIDALGFAAAMTSSFAISAKVFPNNIATVLGSLEIFTGLGLILGPPFGGMLYQSFGYELPFISLGCVLFLMVPFNMYMLPAFDAVPSTDSFFRLFTLPKVFLICFVVFTLSSGLGFLDATLSIFATEKFSMSPGYVGLLLLGVSLPYCLSSPLLGVVSDKFPSVRKWLMVLGGLATALGFCLLGPAPFLHIQSQLWLLIFMLTIIGFSLGMTGIPTFPEILNCAYENGFEEGLSTLGLVSGLFGAVWSIGMFFGPTFGGFMTQTMNFEWAATVEGVIGFLASILLGIYFITERVQTNRPSRVIDGETPEESAPLLGQSPTYSVQTQYQ
ncbi:MFS-type transporter SLC18B1 isoform X2 [Anguilla anguilla]|uniref:MFS-type transporter SLC18B1 isoform X2 n=1 Tax=Anguilla anguilla TaxID=7936 RepID=UPI0015AF3160|nr:MFS-type transporter SLC18B1 isoform X2 [Anguilla anguilla]